MIFPDVNMLLYAYDGSSSFHTPAKNWLEDVLSNETVFFSWQTITGFLRIVTHPSILSNPASLGDAISVVNEWLERDNCQLVHFEKRHWPVFSKMLLDGQANGNLVMDAHIAAMAASCGASVASTDRDFTRFPGIRYSNPLAK